MLKKTTINKLARLIINKSDFKINEWDAKFIAEELIRLGYCEQEK